MAIQIKIMDTNLQEHYMMVNSYKDIFVSENNDSRYKKTVQDLITDAEDELRIP